MIQIWIWKHQSCLTSKLYDKIIKIPSKSHETIPLRWLTICWLNKRKKLFAVLQHWSRRIRYGLPVIIFCRYCRYYYLKWRKDYGESCPGYSKLSTTEISYVNFMLKTGSNFHRMKFLCKHYQLCFLYTKLHPLLCHETAFLVYCYMPQ
jgi:hypothetical protein